MYKILVVGPSWVGDTVLAQPLFRRLRERHSQLVLDVLAPAWTLPLLRRMPEVSEAIPSHFGHGELKLVARWRLARALTPRGYDQAVILPNSFKSAVVPRLMGIPLRTGYAGEFRQPLINDVRRLDPQALPLMAERYAALADPAMTPLVRPLPGLRLTSSEAMRVELLDKLGLARAGPVAALCPGAEYGPAKRWPPAYFAELGRTLARGGHQVWVIGSSKDRVIGEEIAQMSQGTCLNLCGRTSLDEVVDLLAGAQLVVSNDSGLMHVAAAVGAPLLALYGSSSPSFTPPLSQRATVLKLDLPCSPCYRRICPLQHFNCMMQLTPDRVHAAIAASRAGVTMGPNQ